MAHSPHDRHAVSAVGRRREEPARRQAAATAHALGACAGAYGTRAS